MATTKTNSMVESHERPSRREETRKCQALGASERERGKERKKKSKIQFVCRRIGDVRCCASKCSSNVRLWVWHTQSAEWWRYREKSPLTLGRKFYGSNKTAQGSVVPLLAISCVHDSVVFFFLCLKREQRILVILFHYTLCVCVFFCPCSLHALTHSPSLCRGAVCSMCTYIYT